MKNCPKMTQTTFSCTYINISFLCMHKYIYMNCAIINIHYWGRPQALVRISSREQKEERKTVVSQRRGRRRPFCRRWQLSCFRSLFCLDAPGLFKVTETKKNVTDSLKKYYFMVNMNLIVSVCWSYKNKLSEILRIL